MAWNAASAITSTTDLPPRTAWTISASRATIRSDASTTSSARSSGTKQTPLPSAITRSPGRTWTPPTWISVADLNSDGISDIVALYGGYSLDQKFLFLYGETSRTFKTYSLNAPNGGRYQLGASGATADRQFPQVVLSDFNGDHHMDLVTYAVKSSDNTACV